MRLQHQHDGTRSIMMTPTTKTTTTMTMTMTCPNTQRQRTQRTRICCCQLLFALLALAMRLCIGAAIVVVSNDGGMLVSSPPQQPPPPTLAMLQPHAPQQQPLPPSSPPLQPQPQPLLSVTHDNYKRTTTAALNGSTLLLPLTDGNVVTVGTGGGAAVADAAADDGVADGIASVTDAIEGNSNYINKYNNNNNINYNYNNIASILGQDNNNAAAAATFLTPSHKEVVEQLIKQWAPIVWLAPEEKFLPLGVDEFLNHVHAASGDKGKTFMPAGMPIGDSSMKTFLVTNTEVDDLLNDENSFIHGRNPNETPVPIYAVVTLCDSHTRSPPFDGLPVTDSPLPPQPPMQPQLPIAPTAPQLTRLPTAAGAVPMQMANAIHSTRGPYIPVSMDPFDQRNNTMRRSSRLYPVFKRMHRSGATNENRRYHLPLGPSQSMPLPVEQYHRTANNLAMGATNRVGVAAAATETSADVGNIDTDAGDPHVNNFIANLADNVKFSGAATGGIDNAADENGVHYEAPDLSLIENRLQQQQNTKVPPFHVTYWMFYPYSQGKSVCTLSLGPLGRIPFPAVYGYCLGKRKDIGSHIGDWEHMSLYFNGGTEPEAMYVSAHDAGAYYTYNQLTGSFEFTKQETRKGILQRPNFPKTVTTFNNHPVLFAAKGSHGLWTAPGKHRFVKVARLYDINGFGTPWNTWKFVDITYKNLKSYGRSLLPPWLSFKGKWGNPKSKCHPFRRIGLNFCEYTDGPTGIPLKEPHFQCGATYR